MIQGTNGSGRVASATIRMDDDRRYRSSIAMGSCRGILGSVELARRLRAASAVRTEAGDVLERLIVDRAHSEARLAELGKHDAIKAMTGRSAMERAITDTRRMICDMDVLIREIRVEIDGDEAVPLPCQLHA